MIDLSLYPKFQQDIQNKHTNIYPIVRIDNVINISTVKEFIDGTQYFDYGLKVSNIKESIDISKRMFKISNVTLSLNNYPNEDVRLSDTIYNYLNKEVEIFYKSQSCNELSDCLPVYKGLLKDAKYNDKTVTLTLEDRTEKTLHKDVPIANLGYSENVYNDSYINRYIPITYGKVDKAPAVLYKDGTNSEGRIHVISDNVFGVNNEAVQIMEFNSDDVNVENNLTGNINSPLYIYKDNYFRVLPDISDATNSTFGVNNEIAFGTTSQFKTSLDGNSLYIDKEFILDFPDNPPADNLLECVKVSFPNDVKLLKSDNNFTSADNHVISLVNSTINSIEAIIDNPETQNEFIVDEENFLNTSAQVPDNELTVENSDVDTFIVHEFTPHKSGAAIYYPDNDVSTYGYDSGYPLQLQSNWKYIAWLWSSAHLFPTGTVQFVEFPCADLIKIKLINWLAMNTFPQVILESGANHNFRLQTRTPILSEMWESFNNHELVQIFEGVNDFGFEALNNHTFPASVYTFYTTNGNPIFVGQYNSLSIGDTDINLDDFLFFNIFDDGSGKPFLFTLEECAVFSPTNRVYENSESYSVSMKYRCEYNGTNIGNINNNISGDGADCINDEFWMYTFESGGGISGWDYWGTSNFTHSKLLCQKNSSWCMYFPEGIDGTVAMNQETVEGKPFDPNLNCTIKPNTFIPIEHNISGFADESQNFYLVGNNLSFDYDLLNNPNQLAIGSGSLTSTGEKLMFSLPFSDLTASDAIESRTHAYGKINCLFNPQNLETPNTTSNDIFKVILSATDVDGNIINFTEDSLYNTALIEIQGGDALNTHLEEANWSSVSNELNNSFIDTDELGFEISEWNTPEAFNSIALTYSLTGDSTTNMSFQTNITTIGIMQFIMFERALDGNFYIDTFGRANNPSDLVDNELGGVKFKYTDENWQENVKSFIQKPTDIFYHFTEKELGQTDIIDRNSWKKSREEVITNLAFSIKDKINSKKLFEEISKSCNIIPRFKNNGNLAFFSINKTYPGGASDMVVKSDDILKFEIGHTPLTDIYTLVNVKYKKDYEEDEYKKETGYCDGYDFFGNGDSGYQAGYKYGYYDIAREDNILEFESDYIRDKQSAIALRNFLYLYHCNRHAIAKVTLPLKYSHLEIGDIIEFDKIVNNTRSFNEDYTEPIRRNGQIIYPYFTISSVTKSPKNIKIEATQLHKLERSFTAGVGSLSRMSEIGGNFDASIIEGANPEDIPSLVSEYLNLDDWNILYDIILKEESASHKYITSEQKLNADVNGSGTINLNDLNTLGQLIGTDDIVSSEEYTSGDTDVNIDNILGDLNNDGQINVADVIGILNFVLGADITQEQMEIVDSNQDGIINILDVVVLVNGILAGE